MTPHARFFTRALVLALLLWAAPAMAGDVDGKWAGTVSTPGGDLEVAYDFKSDGATLKGTTTSPDGATVEIKKISFLVSLDLGGMAFDINYTGVVTPAEIKLTADFAGMPFEYTVKKAAK